MLNYKKKMILFLLLPFLFQYISTKSLKFITIPFKIQKYTYKPDKEGLLKNHLYKDISTTLSIGTPSQEIPMLIGFGEYTTYILSNKVLGYDGTAIYNKDKSSSYKSSQKYSELFFYQIFNEAYRAKENINLKFPKHTLKNFEFFLATQVGENICYLPYCEILTSPGVLGLRMSPSEGLSESVNSTNFITQLRNKGIIDSHDFTFLFGDDDNGTLIIGEKPDEYDEENYDKDDFVFTKAYIENSKEKDWSLNFDNVLYGDKKLINEKSWLMRVEYGLIDGDKRWQKILEENFFNENIEKGVCFKGKGWNDGHSYYHYYCDKNVDLSNFKPFTFVLNDLHYNLTLTKDDLFEEDGDKMLFLMIFGHYSLILGLPFFKKYQFVFNQGAKTIGLYTKIGDTPSVPVPLPILDKDTNKSFDIIKYAVILVIGIFVVFFGFRYYERNCSKKSKTVFLINRKKQSGKEIQLSDYTQMTSK